MCGNKVFFLLFGFISFLNQLSNYYLAPSMCNICKLWTTKMRGKMLIQIKLNIHFFWSKLKRTYFIYLFIYKIYIRCTDHTWQQFDPLPKYGGKINTRQSDSDRGTCCNCCLGRFCVKYVILLRLKTVAHLLCLFDLPDVLAIGRSPLDKFLHVSRNCNLKCFKWWIFLRDDSELYQYISFC